VSPDEPLKPGTKVELLYPTRDDGVVPLEAEVRKCHLSILPAHRRTDIPTELADYRVDLHVVLPGQTSKSTLMQVPHVDRPGVEERMPRWQPLSGGAGEAGEAAEG
jgi:hypothetical protein